MTAPRAGTRGVYASEKGALGFTVGRVEGNLCYCDYDNGTQGPFIWRFKEGLNTLHDWPGKEGDPSLTEALEALGIRHEPLDGLRRRLYRGTELVGDFNASEGWAFVRAQQVA